MQKPRDEEQKKSPSAALYSSLPSAGQQQKLTANPARRLASMPSYRAPQKKEEARLPQVKRYSPIPQSRYIWVGRAVPLRLIPDSEQFPDMNAAN